MRDPVPNTAAEVAAAMLELPRPWLIGVDVDGTLAPIVARPEMSRLEPNALHAIDRLAQRVGVMVAVVSGRPLIDLRQRFDMPASVMLLGSHGAEVGTEVDHRTPAEESLIASTMSILDTIVASLPGAWIEHKPLAVALHVRQCEPGAADAAMADLERSLAKSDELTLHRGHRVLEIAVRPASKVIAFGRLRKRLEPATTAFLGDDQSDERVFVSLGAQDLSVKVGPGATDARHRLASPTEVVELLLLLGDSVGGLSTDER